MMRKSEDAICKGIDELGEDSRRSSHDKIRSAGDKLGEDRIGEGIERVCNDWKRNGKAIRRTAVIRNGNENIC